MNKKILILLVASLTDTQVWAGSVTVPNNFVDGTTASAGEVNDNFTAVENAVNDNDTNITTNTSNIGTNTNDIQTNAMNIGINATGTGVNATGIQTNAATILTNTSSISTMQQGVSVKANGVKVGTYLTSTFLRGVQNQSVYVLSDTGYIFGIEVVPSSPSFGKLMYLLTAPVDTPFTFYELPDCQGQAYVNAVDLLNIEGIGIFAHGSGFVYRDNDRVLYITKNVTPVAVTYSSTRHGLDINSCQNGTASIELLPANQNDPLITGVTFTDFLQPLSIEQ